MKTRNWASGKNWKPLVIFFLYIFIYKKKQVLNTSSHHDGSEAWFLPFHKVACFVPASCCASTQIFILLSQHPENTPTFPLCECCSYSLKSLFSKARAKWLAEAKLTARLQSRNNKKKKKHSIFLKTMQAGYFFSCFKFPGCIILSEFVNMFPRESWLVSNTSELTQCTI